VSPLSEAAPPVADDSQSVNPEARLYFERGVRAFETGRFREAVELFRRADRVEPSPLLSFNVAHAYERMKDDTSALAAYREYLRRLPRAQNRFEVSQRIAELELALQRRGIMQLSVLSEPPGATLLIDGAALGVTPWTGELAPGRHVVLARLRGYGDVEQIVELPVRHALDVLLKLGAPAAPAATAPPARHEPPHPIRREPAAARGATRDTAAEAWAAPSWWTWALLGSSGALLLGAGAFELSRRDLEEDARQEPRQIDYRNELEAMEARQATARVLLGVGAAVALVGGVSLYLDLSARKGERAPQTALACTAGSCQLALRSRW
jgi:tetratricopeptide (TPR) repeat protein